ncbi:MAG: TraI domain-containing protein, partial [Gallionella sp.]|nr:TraI domain-containing protein [Gallionella sp.]
PASQSHHHRGAGGLLRHSLEVGLWSLQQTERMLIRGVTTPKSRRAIEPRWRLAVFFAGICHDLGKAVTDLAVTDRESKEKWRPYNQSLYEWAQSLDISNYFLHWQEGRAKHHTSVSSTVINNIIGKASFDWISAESTEVLIWLTESVNCNPGQTNQIYDLVVKADQLSVERDLKTMGVAMAGYEIGVPIERYLTDIMRRLVREGIWRINEPGARIWNIGGHIYLVWPAAGEEIAKRASGEDIPGLPKTPDGILDMMVEREIAYLREEEGDRYYYIAPSVLTEKIPDLKLKAIRLRDQALISSTIIPPVEGMIAEGREQMTEDRGEGAVKPHNVMSSSLRSLSSEELTGGMGEILKVLIDEFRTGKKSLRDLAAMDAGGCLHLKWPDAFAGYGFAPKQILDGLTEHGWMEPHSEMVKVGEAEFANGTAKAIKLVRPVSDLFPNSPGGNEHQIKTPPEVIIETSQQQLFPSRTEPRKTRQKRVSNERSGELGLKLETSPRSFSSRLFDALFAEAKSKKIKPDADGYCAMPKRDVAGLTQKLSGLACASKVLGKLQVDKAIISGQTTVRFCQQKQSKQ